VPIQSPVRPLDELAQKWRELADRRREHFVDLYHSGRWRHYYSEEQFVAQMREVIRAAEDWARLTQPHAVVPAE
jgi:uncharacterized repeat protein (TIGR03809 family)